MATQTYKSWSVVTASTTAFTVCFMVWMMFAVIGIPIKQNLGLNETQFGGRSLTVNEARPKPECAGAGGGGGRNQGGRSRREPRW